MLAIPIEQCDKLFRRAGLREVLSKLETTSALELASAARGVGYNRMHSWRIAKQYGWMLDEELLRDGDLIVNPYDRRFDKVFRHHNVRRILWCLEEFGPLHTRYLSRLLRIDKGLVSRTVRALEKAGIVTSTKGERGERSRIALKEQLQRHATPEDLVSRMFSNVVKAIRSEFQSNSIQNICVTLSDSGKRHGKLTAILSGLEDAETMEHLKNMLLRCADRVLKEQGVAITDIVFTSEGAWLRQLLNMTPDPSRELEESIESPPIVGKKPVPAKLLYAVFAGAPPTRDDIKKWLKKKLIEPISNDDYEFTSRGLHAIRVQARVHWQPIREHLKVGSIALHWIYA